VKKIVIFCLALSVYATAAIAQNEKADAQTAGPAAKDGLIDLIKDNATKFTSFRKNYIGYSVYNDDGSDKGELKFQLSLKYQLIGLPDREKLVCSPEKGTLKCVPGTEQKITEPDEDSRKWFNNFFFGYTQKSLWSIQKLSKPFKENNYSPEFFYIYDNTDNKKNDNMLRYVILGIYKHESTGEGGAGSHGWNINYVEPFFQFGKDVAVSTKLWMPYFFISKDKAFEDPNMLDFYGYGELNAKWRFWKSSQLSTTFRHGLRRGKYGLETQLDMDLNAFGFKKNDYINPAFFVQVWKGYGETLKTFDRNTLNIIVGISAIR
jgi:outer membrane phospholipase A